MTRPKPRVKVETPPKTEDKVPTPAEAEDATPEADMPDATIVEEAAAPEETPKAMEVDDID